MVKEGLQIQFIIWRWKSCFFLKITNFFFKLRWYGSFPVVLLCFSESETLYNDSRAHDNHFWESLGTSTVLQKMSKIHKKSMKINGNQWKWMKINENQWKTMKINENLWILMKINGNPWKSMGFFLLWEGRLAQKSIFFLLFHYGFQKNWMFWKAECLLSQMRSNKFKHFTQILFEKSVCRAVYGAALENKLDL